jgi:pyruvate-ferredoxin/flavodoxin oxidoreductase
LTAYEIGDELAQALLEASQKNEREIAAQRERVADLIAYSHCIAHGYDMMFGMEQQKKAVLSGYWPLMRYNPALRLEGKNPFQLDSRAPSMKLKEYAYQEARYSMLAPSNPDVAAELLKLAQEDVHRNWRVYENRAAMPAGEKPDGQSTHGSAVAAKAVPPEGSGND